MTYKYFTFFRCLILLLLTSGIEWMSASVTEGEELRLSCPKGKFIKIFQAEYGQIRDGFKCSAESSLYIVDQRCGGKRRCSLLASNTEFGDPCAGVIKRLIVQYRCDQGGNYRYIEIPEGKKSSLSCPEGTFIRVYDALYGIAGGAPDDRLGLSECGNRRSLDAVSGRCQYSTNCEISSSNSLFGDPCPGVEKILYIEYACQEDTVNRALACEHASSLSGSDIKLDCPSGFVIDVINARYGRSHPYVCPQNGANPMNPLGCMATNSRLRLVNECQGKSSCVTLASNSVFGDPCVGTEKYLEVEYQCKVSGEKADWAVATEGLQLSLLCPKNYYIHVIAADYGQTINENCFSESTFFIVQQRCEGKRKCVLSASNSEFGEPCMGTLKRLRVKFHCEQGKNFRYAEIPEGRSTFLSCSEGTSIRVYDALYGIAGGAPDDRLVQSVCGNSRSLDAVSGRCQYSKNCEISSSNSLFGDPCPRVEKILYIEYFCQRDTLKRAIGCEHPSATIGSDVRLECPSGFGIDVIRARYGRSHPYVCPQKGVNPFNPAGCNAANTATYVSSACQRKSSCIVFASNKVFGDPCVGNEKYLEVEYKCKSNAN